MPEGLPNLDLDKWEEICKAVGDELGADTSVLDGKVSLIIDEKDVEEMQKRLIAKIAEKYPLAKFV